MATQNAIPMDNVDIQVTSAIIPTNLNTVQPPENLPGPRVEGKDDIIIPQVHSMESPDIMNHEGGSKSESCLMAILRNIITFINLVWTCVIPCLWCAAIRTLSEYETAVQFRLGRVVLPPKQAGMWFFIPGIDVVHVVDKREKTIDVKSQQVLTRDLVTCVVNAVVYFKVDNPVKSIIMVKDFRRATANLAQTTLRAVVGETLLDDVLQRRELVSQKIEHILDTMTDAWGVKVTAVEIKDIQLPPNMQRAMAAQAEAERVRLGKIIAAQAEMEAAETLVNAASQMGPTALTLRYFNTLQQVAGKNNKTTVIPIPTQIFSKIATEMAQFMPKVVPLEDFQAQHAQEEKMKSI